MGSKSRAIFWIFFYITHFLNGESQIKTAKDKNVFRRAFQEKHEGE
jgi:hypothetical protein